MPNAKVLSEKQAIVDALAQRISGAGAGILRPGRERPAPARLTDQLSPDSHPPIFDVMATSTQRPRYNPANTV